MKFEIRRSEGLNAGMLLEPDFLTYLSPDEYCDWLELVVKSFRDHMRHHPGYEELERMYWDDTFRRFIECVELI